MATISRAAAKKTFYSGELRLVVHLVEGHAADPGRRRRQVRGCEHNVVYRVEIAPYTKSVRGARQRIVEWVCPPAHLSRAIDSSNMMRDAASAALSFADNAGHPIQEYGAFTDRGWHVASTKTRAWPPPPGRRRTGSRAR